MTAADLPGLPAAPLRRWLRRTLPDLDLDGPWRPEIISGGLSNITYRLPIGETTYVLRRPPLGPTLPRAHDMRREYRILTALWPTAVPVPQPVALCTDPDMIGAPFYLMHEVTGAVLRTGDDTQRLTPQCRAEIADALIATLAQLHQVDPRAVGLGDPPPSSDYTARQLRIWAAQWQRSTTRQLPDMDTLLTRLADHLPPSPQPTIVHGDYRLDNTIVDLSGRPRLAAVLDWELSTLGDPLADLGLMLVYWHDAGDHERSLIPVARHVTTWKGFPSSATIAERYAHLTGRDLAYLPFYCALGAMKLAVILEGVHARYLAGTTVTDGYAHVGEAVPVLVARGLRSLRKGDRVRRAATAPRPANASQTGSQPARRC